MNSKTSLFNKSLFISNFKRLWWTPVLTFIMMFLTSVVPFFDNISYISEIKYDTYQRQVEYVTSRFENNTVFMYVFGIGAAVCICSLIFNYLNKSNAVSCIHGLPVKRESLFFTNTLSAFIMTVIPALVCCVFFAFKLSTGLAFSNILKFFAVYLLYTLIVISISTFVAMLVGNSAAHIAFTGVLALLPLFLTSFIAYVCSHCLYGFYSTDYMFDALLRYVYLMPQTLLTYKCLIYIVLTAIFFALSLVLYKYRDLENHGEIIAFPRFKGIFKVAFAVCSGILGYFYSVSMWYMQNLLIMIPFAIIGLIIAHMLAQKSFSLKGIVKSLVATVIVIIAFFCVIQFDLTGFESRVPDADDVESIRFTTDHVSEQRYVHIDGVGKNYRYKEVYYPVYDSPEEIEAFINLHEYKVKNRTLGVDFYLGHYYRPDVSIEYTLKNGKKMYRRYTLTHNERMQYFAPICETDTFRAYQYPILDGTQKDYLKVTITDIRDTNDKAIMSFDGNDEISQKLIEAIKLDRRDITYEQYLEKSSNEAVTRITLYYTKPLIDEFGFEVKAKEEQSENYTVSLYDTNTLKVLEEIGFYAQPEIKGKEGLTSVTVAISDSYLNYDVYNLSSYPTKETVQVEEYYDKYGVYYQTGSDLTFTDTEQMNELYDYAFNTIHTPYNDVESLVRIAVIFTYQDGSHFPMQIDVSNKTLPQFVKDIWKIK